MSIKVSIGPDGIEPEDTGCECNKDSWPLILVCLGFGTSFLTILVCVLALLQLSSIVLSVYIAILSLFGLMAELRRIKFLRGLFYHILKYVYFLTNYYCRGIYYIFLGTVLISDVPLNFIAAAVSIGMGVLLIVIHTIFKLPNYVDRQEVEAAKKAAEARAASGAAPIISTNNYSPAATPKAAENPYASQTASSGYTPATAAPPAATATGTGAYVPPAAATAYMANQQVEDPYDEEPITSSAGGSRARMNNNDDALAAAYYAQQQQAQNTRASAKVADPDDPFARDDSQYRPNRY